MRDEYLEGAILEDTLQPGLLMEMIVKHGEHHGRYKTKIEDKAGGTLTIAVPYGKGFLPLRPGEKLNLIFVFEQESYLFPAEILNRQISDLPTFRIAQPRIAMRIQRRLYRRIHCLQVAYYQMLGPDKTLGPRQEAQVLEISGGGLLLSTNKKLHEEDILLVQLTLNNDFFDVMCLVKRSEEIETGSKGFRGYYRVSVEYRDISERERDKIVRYVFDIERDLRRRGMI
ncbi:MAG: PilZ domain-containing protein [Peptococcaceae bacterium]|nr:PilZ domain-containing protein [Peptococcaceae bacterium]